MRASTTYEILRDQAHRQPDRTALVFLEDGTAAAGERSWTYGELLADVTRAANAFRRLGVQRSDVVSLLMPNLPEAQIGIWAAEAVGIANPVNSYLTQDQIVHLLNAAQTKILVTEGPSSPDVWDKVQTLRSLVPSLAHVIAVDGKAAAGSDWSSLLAESNPDALQFEPPTGEDVASYFHTGGTTGTPKLAMHSHANEVSNSAAIADTLDYPSHRAIGLAIPLFHVAGTIAVSLSAFTAGITVVMLGPLGFRNPRAINEIWKTVDSYDMSALLAVPTAMSAILDVPATEAEAQRLRLTISGSAPVPAALALRWANTFGRLPLVGYGLTEGTCGTALCRSGAVVKPGLVGPALPDCEIRIVAHSGEATVDPETAEDCGVGESGLILTRGPNVFLGYREPQFDHGVLLGDGWLNTGDLGYLDADGYLCVTGREKDLIKRSGHGIDPAGVEEVLTAHPLIAVAAVVARPDVHAGELPMAFVQLRDSAAGRFDAEEVRAWCSERVGDPAAAPVAVVAVDQLPLTAVGKVSKVDLRWRAARLAVESEVSAAFAGPFTTYGLELTDAGARYVGRVEVTGASTRSVSMLRNRLDLLPVPTAVEIAAAAHPQEIGRLLLAARTSDIDEERTPTMATNAGPTQDRVGDLGGVTIEARGGVCLIGLDRPSKRNALNPEVMRELTEAYEHFEANPELRCAVLFGHGQAFCGGGDLLRLKDAFERGELDFSHTYDPFQMTGKTRTKPVVAAVHGICFAGGLELALATDIVLAAEGTMLGQPEAARGLFAFGGGSVRLPQIMGWGNAQRFLLTGDPMTAEEALRYGVVQEVVSADELTSRAFALAEKVAASAPIGVLDTLATGRLGLTHGQAAAFEETARRRDLILRTRDAEEGLRSFLERRPGRYLGE
ncbi:MAG: crotonase/enoyl-CoA hydratase family protein [Sporichthyaceae bacterium]